jgi:hypothetical protein
MNIKHRVIKLESARLNEANRIEHIINFIVKPGTDEVTGYRCQAREILRRSEESIEALQQRCCESVTSADEERVVFYPIYLKQKQELVA